MITSLMETLDLQKFDRKTAVELQNVDHKTTSTMLFKLHQKTLLVTSLKEIITSNLYFEIFLFQEQPGVATFADAIKFAKNLYILNKSQKTQKNVSRCNFCLNFLIYPNSLIFTEKMLMSAEIKRCVTGIIHFLDLIQVRYNFTNIHPCGTSYIYLL